MSENTTLSVCTDMPATVTGSTETNTKTFFIEGNDLKALFMQNDSTTVFAGKARNVVISTVARSLDGSREQMLVDAINNRTRERNYYHLYSRLLENEITEDEFDREIDENPDDYLISTDKIPTEQEFHDAIALAEHIKGIETTGDIETLFSFSGKEFNDYCKRLLDGSL